MDERVEREGYCPVCGYRTLPRRPSLVRHEVCPICHWEDDLVQQSRPDSTVGANGVSLAQARVNFRECGAVEPRSSEHTRAPTDDDERDSAWPYDEG